MKKMIINSFYNTLIDKEDAIPLSTMLEIERIRKSGNKYVILTNRSAKELEFYNRDFPFIDYIISFNGNYVVDLENNKSSKITENQAIEIINLLKYDNRSLAQLSRELDISLNILYDINRCRTWKFLHNYKKNVRNEARKEMMPV